MKKIDDFNRKCTLFGTIVGDSIYNLNEIGDLACDANNMLKSPPIITKIDVVENPFKDMFIREINWNKGGEEIEEKKTLPVPKKKKKMKKKIKLGDSDSEDEEVVSFKIKSSHDVLNDKKLSKQTIQTKEVKDKKKHVNSDYIVDETDEVAVEKKKEPVKEINDDQEDVNTELIEIDRKYEELRHKYKKLEEKKYAGNTNDIGDGLLGKRNLEYIANSKAKKDPSAILNKLQAFKKRLKTKTDKKQRWMKNTLNFAIDSTNAFKTDEHKRRVNEEQID